ncbi:glycine betaine ABC transporter substrate-binding protein [Ornithinibacillus californiensis]|uniref:glycine betaine ABC transporter substrate-binding protein n=1 Tax=Ornithinibacillus californiensis TaxID=161536 RepID=UPI00064D9D02|nr:glycine betaine ABC transporter substrate-binding protein [Ornithinibacillus californiensis]
MFEFKWKKVGVIAALSLSFVAAGCSQEGNESEGGASKSVSEELEYTITGIEPGAGQTETNEKALAEYESLAGWEQETSSSAAMLTSLEKTIDNEEPIIVAAWSPHYKFAKWDLKYLEDPKGIFGEAEYITTIVRHGLKDEMPEAYTLFDRFHWELADMEAALLKAQEMDFDFEVVAQEWVEENQEIVAEWTEGVEPVDGTSLHLASTAWDTELFSANVAKLVFEQLGYNVKLSVVDPSVLFEAISTGDADGSLSPWMPATHGAFYGEYEGQFEDLGENLSGAKIGLAVPTYMEIDSIEDLEPKE